MSLRSIFDKDKTKRSVLVEGRVIPEPARCIQCGICSFHCPIDIDVRRHAWEGKTVIAGRCLTCGECVARCPRGVLRFERIEVFNEI